MDTEAEKSSPHPDNYARGLELYHRGLYEQALAELELVIGREGAVGQLAKYYRAMSHRAMGIEALRDGQFARAEEHLRSTLDSIGRWGDLSSYLASLYARTGRCGRCADEMERWAEKEIDNAGIRRRLALAQWRAGRRPQAYMTLTEALRELGDESTLYLQLGLFYASEEQYAQAKVGLTHAVQTDPANPDAHYYLGLVAAAEGDILAAGRSFQRAFELRPSDLMCAYQLALAGKAAEQNGYAFPLHLPEPLAPAAGSEIRQLAGYVCHEPDFVQALLALPKSEIDEELFELLGGVLQMAIDAHPAYADLHHYCSRIFHRLNRTESAIDYARRALRINPRYVQALIHLGNIYAETHRPTDAVEYLVRAVECGGAYADIHCLIGELMMQTNRPINARMHLQRALELNADYTRATEAMTSLAA